MFVLEGDLLIGGLVDRTTIVWFIISVFGVGSTFPKERKRMDDMLFEKLQLITLFVPVDSFDIWQRERIDYDCSLKKFSACRCLERVVCVCVCVCLCCMVIVGSLLSFVYRLFCCCVVWLAFPRTYVCTYVTWVCLYCTVLTTVCLYPHTVWKQATENKAKWSGEKQHTCTSSGQSLLTARYRLKISCILRIGLSLEN